MRLVPLLLVAFWFAAVTARAALTATNFPAAVSNAYNGVVTLQITGLPYGVSNVLVQKYLDANTNGIIDSGDLLVQQFPLTSGVAGIFTNAGAAATVTLTNFLPGDIASVTGQITAPLNFQNGDFAQNVAGQYLYKVTSAGQSVTSLFVVTNSLYSSCLTGAVVNAYSSPATNVPNALVLLYTAAQNGALNVQAGAVANNSGYFTLRAPPGNYFIAAAKSNFVYNASSSGIQLYSGVTNVANLGLTPATTNVVGRIADAATGSGLPGVSGMAVSTNNLLSFYFTDTNGNFLAPIIGSNVWQVQVNPFAAAFQSHLTSQTAQFLNVSNQAVKITNALPSATTVFYGLVSNVSAMPMPGLYLYANDSAGDQSLGFTVQNGQYALPAGTGQWTLGIVATNYPLLTNYVVSPGYVQTNFTAVNQAIRQNFTLTFAPYTISGTVEDINGNPIGGVQVYANAPNAQAFTVFTAANGAYLINVSPGLTWTVGVSSNSLASLGYTNVPAAQNVFLSNANIYGVNFYILVCGEIQVLTTNLPAAMVGSYYDTSLEAQSCQPVTNWTTAYGITLTSLFASGTNSFPAGTAIYSDSQLIGINESYFSFGLAKNGSGYTPFLSNVTGTATEDPDNDTKENFENLSATITVSGPITNTINIQFGGSGTTWVAQPTTQNGSTYTTVLTDSLYQMGIGNQPYVITPGLFMTASGNPSNTVASTLGILPSIASGNSLNLASTMPYAGSNNAIAWVLTPRGTNEYYISAYGPQQTNVLPPGITLYPNGTLAGAPAATTTNNTFNFTVAAQDSSLDTAVQPLSLFVYPLTTISNGTNTPAQTTRMLQASKVFPMQINGAIAGQNYTVLMSTNLPSTNWVSIYTTNSVNTNALVVPDPNATNPTRFYRILISP